MKIPEINFDINLDDFDVDIDISFETDFDKRYIKPPICKEIPERYLKYSDAEKLAKEIDFKKNDRVFCVINGTFFFGDFIEAFILHNKFVCKEMTISTLSMNMNNIDSLYILLAKGWVKKLNLIISGYFFSHERNGLIKYIYEKLDIENKFQLSVADTHCKLCIFETFTDEKIIIHGSANLRSSSNIEQFMIEDNKELYDFNNEYQQRIIEMYRTINKPIRYQKLWKTVTNK